MIESIRCFAKYKSFFTSAPNIKFESSNHQSEPFNLFSILKSYCKLNNNDNNNNNNNNNKILNNNNTYNIKNINNRKK